MRRVDAVAATWRVDDRAIVRVGNAGGLPGGRSTRVCAGVHLAGASFVDGDEWRGTAGLVERDEMRLDDAPGAAQVELHVLTCLPGEAGRQLVVAVLLDVGYAGEVHAARVGV